MHPGMSLLRMAQLSHRWVPQALLLVRCRRLLGKPTLLMQGHGSLGFPVSASCNPVRHLHGCSYCI